MPRGGGEGVLGALERGHALLEHAHRRVAVAGVDELVRAGGDEARLRRLGVGIDEALREVDRLGGLAVLAAAGAGVHQPGPRAPLVAHRAFRRDPALPLLPLKLGLAGLAKRQGSVNAACRVATGLDPQALAQPERSISACGGRAGLGRRRTCGPSRLISKRPVASTRSLSLAWPKVRVSNSEERLVSRWPTVPSWNQPSASFLQALERLADQLDRLGHRAQRRLRRPGAVGRRRRSSR